MIRHEYQGMYTCFEVDAPLLGLQLHLPDEVHLPFWPWSDKASMVVYHREYNPVAVILHRGQDQQGHLPSDLLSDEGWFLTDDNRGATIDVFAWLVRNDVFHPSGVASPQWNRDTLDLMCYVSKNDFGGLLENEHLLHVLRSCSEACGCLYFSEATLNQRFKQCSPGLWLDLGRPCRLRCFMVPCG